ncbi:MAG: polysaccharide lyase [Bacteroidetes bacterium]|nr:polysaccharide lyase [Bacteroidota bacterium]
MRQAAETLPAQVESYLLSDEYQLAKAAAYPIIYEETFEGDKPLATAHSIEIGADHSLTFVTDPVFKGAHAARFELRETDPFVKTGKRAEVTLIKGYNLPGNEMWYSFAAYFPAEGFAYDRKQEIISQWYQKGTPATALRVEDDQFMLHTGNLPDTRKKLDLGKVTKDSWHQFVFHIIHSYEADGLIEVWHNGSKVLSHTGGNMYNNGIMPKWKVGIYKSSFKHHTSDVDHRVVFFDDIRVGSELASYELMVEGAATTPSWLQE